MISRSVQLLVSGAVALIGVILLIAAIVHERRMHAHRQPGITYAQATLRRDGGWRRRDLFTEAGLRHQRRASLYGIIGAALLVASLLVWIALGTS
jgi:hypothetical protein